MSSKPVYRGSPAHSTAVVIRLVAFVVAAVAVIAIPSTLVATATGMLSHQSALVAMGSAVGLILMAALAVRPFNPL